MPPSRSEASARIANLRTKDRGERNQIGQINARLEQIRMRMSSTGIAMTELGWLLMEGVTSNRTALLGLERQRQQLLLEAQSSRDIGVEVLSEATPPLAPSSRSKKLYLGRGRLRRSSLR